LQLIDRNFSNTASYWGRTKKEKNKRGRFASTRSYRTVIDRSASYMARGRKCPPDN